jgi:lysozyme
MPFCCITPPQWSYTEPYNYLLGFYNTQRWGLCMSRQVNTAGLDLVRSFEGLKNDAYRCPAGVWTIGYGHTNGVKPGMSITDQQADAYLAEDLMESGKDIEKLVTVPLTDNQFSALTSFVFNAGINSLKTSTLLKRLNKGDYDAVPSELAKWVKARNPKTGNKVTLKGLVRRRAAEAELWLKNDDEDPFLSSSDMPQAIHADETRIAYIVAARNGLRLREGAGTNFDILQTLPENTEVFITSEKDGWAAIDLEGDGSSDGWVARDFLRPVTIT